MSDEEKIESTISEIETTIPVEATVIKSTSISRGDDINRLLNQVINLNDNKIVHEPTCPICASPCRAEIEKEYIDKKSYSEAKKLFKEKTGKDLDIGAFKNHIESHIESVSEIKKVEFSNRVKRLYDQNLTTIDRISVGVAIITDNLMSINSLAPTNTESAADIAKIRSAETARLMSSFQALLKLQAQILGEMKSSGELMTIPQKEFVNIFINAIQNAKTDKERETIKGLLDRIEALAKKSQY